MVLCYCGLSHAIPALLLPRLRDRSLAPACLAIPHRTVAHQSLGGRAWAQSQVHQRHSCALSDLLRVTRTGSLRGPVRGTHPVRSPDSRWRYRVGSGAAAWDGDEGSGLIFQTCHCTPPPRISSVPDTVPQRGRAAGGSWLGVPFSSFGGRACPGKLALSARPAAAQAKSSLSTPNPQVFIEVILGIFSLSSRHIPGILSQPFQLGSRESAGGCWSPLVPRASCLGTLGLEGGSCSGST